MSKPLFASRGVDIAAKMAGSEMLHRFDTMNWQSTSLGPIEGWPASLISTVRIMLASPVPMVLLVGREGILIYNEGYKTIAGKRHPQCFGASAFSSWPEVADFNKMVIDTVFDGGTLSYEDQQFTLYRNGMAEEVWLNLNYSPVIDEDSVVIAALAILSETTKRVLAERALVRSREQLSLALGASGIVGTWDWRVSEDKVYSDRRFSSLYGVDIENPEEGAPITAYLSGIHPEDVEVVSRSMQAAMASGERFSAEYRLLQKNGEVRWVLAEGQPSLDAAGQCTRFPGVAVDITAQKAAAEAHERSEAAFRTLADAMPQMVWSTQPDGFHDYYNARWYEFTGMPDGSTDGEGWNGMFHPEDQERAWEAWGHSLNTGDPYQIEYRLRHHSGVYRWVLGRALPVRDEKGAISRWYGTCTDIHDAKMAMAEREIVAHELSHRIKNIFSVLSGIIGLSARSAPESRGFAEQLRKRIEAMGRAHDFVRPHSKSSRPIDVETTIFGLLQRLLEPYAAENNETRINFRGDDVPIGDSAATPLALLLHELATNSAKYGALSHAAGRLDIIGKKAGDSYGLEWKESGSLYPLRPPEVDGFGSRLMKISVEGQLGGTLGRAWTEHGIEVSVTMPIASISRSSKLSQPRLL
ncbi:PAS domain-containing protein [Rhizobium sp. 32-5/1]|uniref:sensor histidine kinase n=1 Tax=Rhizobium sp. 32-5/1 TaxID=3019602 RepID=UPI00240CEB02|nr:PAS domain-containing protein [Rhizobium sp. 32-5/1]WEZ82750.1 PAS domain-containing protein [Rhizobium sp. 32-5/1]